MTTTITAEMHKALKGLGNHATEQILIALGVTETEAAKLAEQINPRPYLDGE